MRRHAEPGVRAEPAQRGAGALEQARIEIVVAAEAPLTRPERAVVAAAALIEHRQEREADAGLASRGGDARRHLRGVGVGRAVGGVVQVMELADGAYPASSISTWTIAAMASTSSGVSRSRKRYIRSRQVQKLSRPSAPRRSVSPAMARWKAWLWRRLVTPALIDCHTHIVFGGNRAREFEMRLKGASYEEIARAGGGIVSTVTATREAERGRAAGAGLSRVDALIAEGVATVEIKSGYGLDIETELKMLRVARALAEAAPGAGADLFPRRAVPCPSTGPRRRLYRRGLPARARRRRGGGAGRCGGRLLRGHRLHPDQIARVFDRPKRWACRSSCTPSSFPPRRHRAGGGARRAVGGSCRIRWTSRRGGDGAGGNGGRAAARRVLHAARDAGAARRRFREARRADGGGDRLQPRLVAAGLAAAGDEHGLHAVPA
jgi:hypothetical protein